MTDAVLTSLAQTGGPLTVALVGAFLVLRAIHSQLSAVQEKRVADAQVAMTRVLELVAAQHEQMAQLVKALDDNADAIQGLRQLLESQVADRKLQRR